MSNKLGTDKVLREFKQGLRPLVRKMAITSANFFQDDVFNAQGFIDGSIDRWKPSKGKGKTLVKTGRGRRSIRPQYVSDRGAKIVAGAPYMKQHNEGLGRFPKRQFMGRSKNLDERVHKVIVDFFDKL